jgi:hypothetical protein
LADSPIQSENNLMVKKAKAKTNKSGKIDGRSKAARAAKAGAGGNGRDLHLADNGGNDEAMQASFLQHRNLWNNALAKLKVAEKALKEVVADAKAEGFLKLHFQIADMLAAGPKKEAKVVAAVKHRIEVAKWIGHAMGKRINLNQLDLFGPDAPAGDPVQAAYEHGEKAGLDGETANVPGQYSANDLSQAWLSGHHRGQATIQKGIKPLETAGQRHEKGAEDRPDADAAPTAGWGASKLGVEL